MSLKKHYITFFKIVGSILAEDYNANNALEIEIDLLKGQELLKTIEAINPTIFSRRKSIYRPSDNNKISDLLALSKAFLKITAATCLEFSSDYLIIIKLNSKIITKGTPCILCNAKTK